MTQQLLSLFRQWSGEDAALSPLCAHASARKIYRLSSASGATTAIGVVFNNAAENRAFVEFSRYFRAQGLPVPEIYGEDLAHGAYLQEDLGDETLLMRVQRQGVTSEVVALYERVLTWLVKFQFEAGKGIDYSLCNPVEEHGTDAYLWDLHYFRDAFLRRTAVTFDADALARDFTQFAQFLGGLYSSSRDGPVFMYRDFQARNIMVRGDAPYFIDYQSGRRGSPLGDVAMLLNQSKAALPAAVREQLLTHYYRQSERYLKKTRAEFDAHYRAIEMALLLHHLGTYGRFGLGAGQLHFLQSIPGALATLRALCAKGPLPVEAPELNRVLAALLTYAERPIEDITHPQLLTVTLQSFSYKHGIPVHPFDEAHGSKSGGGFMFDCRCLPNPGRLAEYKNRSGKDPDVVHYLEANEEVVSFRTHVIALVSQAVQRYINRGFTELVVEFGCTGGQHRSVYFTETVSRYLFMNFPVRVVVAHRELPRLGLC